MERFNPKYLPRERDYPGESGPARQNPLQLATVISGIDGFETDFDRFEAGLLGNGLIQPSPPAPFPKPQVPLEPPPTVNIHPPAPLPQPTVPTLTQMDKEVIKNKIRTGAALTPSEGSAFRAGVLGDSRGKVLTEQELRILQANVSPYIVRYLQQYVPEVLPPQYRTNGTVIRPPPPIIKRGVPPEKMYPTLVVTILPQEPWIIARPARPEDIRPAPIISVPPKIARAISKYLFLGLRGVK